MAKGLSYADAVKLLGAPENKTVKALDMLTGGILLGTSASGSTLALSLFGAKGELFRLTHELVGGLKERMNGLSRHDRTERLAAAQRVLVVAAFFEVVREVDLPFDIGELRLDRADQVAMSGGDPSEPLADSLTSMPVPLIAPALPYERALDAMLAFHQRLAERLHRFVMGLAVWDRLEDAERGRLLATLIDAAPQAATRRFEEHFRRLGAEFPEVAFWADRQDHRATRAEIGRVEASLSGLQRILDEVAAGRLPDDRRAGLARRYRARLGRPITDSGGAPPGMVIPALEHAYVNPCFRVRSAGASARVGDESWWRDAHVRDDLQEFLAGQLTSPDLVSSPLLLLGQPGSGKSALTQVLAARLPETDFMVVRVALRETPADADLQEQIEHAVRDATGETVNWPQLVRSADGALPVVILDGFDELLQATGTSQSDYLQQVARFQEREADQGRPVAVIVTSRTAVADRARLPATGVVAIRLEPFSDAQVGQWLDTWNTANASHLARRGLSPLRPETALAHPDLAVQPLLLLMLALYDADSNELHNDSGTLNLAELYERLLVSFAKREIEKTNAALDENTLTEAIEDELLRLSIAAFAMFNRGRQWTTEQELTDDLAALLPEGPSGTQTGFKAPLTRGQTVLGRFFFVHRSQALTHESRLSTYEFLHATFGEFLVARLVARELEDLAAFASVSTGRRQVPDDRFLHTLLSCATLANREPVMEFLKFLLGGLPDPTQSVLGDLLLDAFRTALLPQQVHEAYAPVPRTITARHTVYSANVLLLTALVRQAVTGRELFPGASDPVDAWSRHARLLKSQLPHDSWTSLIGALDVSRMWNDAWPEVQLAPRSPQQHLRLDMQWTLRGEETFRTMEELQRDSRFLCDTAQDMLLHTIEPLGSPNGVGALVPVWFTTFEGDLFSPANALINLWAQSSVLEIDIARLQRAYERCLAFTPGDSLISIVMVAKLLRQLAADADRLPREWRAGVLQRIKPIIRAHSDFHPWAREAFHDFDVDFGAPGPS
ncbi:NACHT domain-containing protein [Actinomadura sp. GTD37]|uniref:NACHT domain-containing protein n=1 Tax=Actinomadura sp. GTD37 TaxID=1778030 RepID=UPI0035BF1252